MAQWRWAAVMLNATGEMQRAYIGLGSNLHDPIRQVRAAFRALESIPRTHVAAQSRLYRSLPMGPANQPDYINAVAAVDTALSPHALLDELQGIERRQGRVRGPQRWGPRIIDLDLLLYGDAILHDDVLTVPHPGIVERNFVLYPLYEIAPDLDLPGHGSLAAVVENCSEKGLQAVA